MFSRDFNHQSEFYHVTFTTTVNESYLQWRTKGLISSSVGNSGEICLATAGVNITVDFTHFLQHWSICLLYAELGCLNEDWHF